MQTFHGGLQSFIYMEVRGTVQARREALYLSTWHDNAATQLSHGSKLVTMNPGILFRITNKYRLISHRPSEIGNIDIEII
jgi:hypothetical protein